MADANLTSTRDAGIGNIHQKQCVDILKQMSHRLDTFVDQIDRAHWIACGGAALAGQTDGKGGARDAASRNIFDAITDLLGDYSDIHELRGLIAELAVTDVAKQAKGARGAQGGAA